LLATKNTNKLNKNQKAEFLESLDVLTELNTATAERTRSLQYLCAACNTPPPHPTAHSAGQQEPFGAVAAGEWRVVYAPHMDFMGRILRARFSPVIYQLDNDTENTIVSHARVQLPLVGAWWLSASGTYGSVVDDEDDGDRVVARVTFDEAWVRRIGEEEDDNGNTASSSSSSSCSYYASIDHVPDSFEKELIRRVGRTFFIEPFAIFPVSYLDENLVVFEFELLGTRICAYKQPSPTIS